MNEISNIGTELKDVSENLKKMFVALLIFCFITAVAILIISIKHK